MLWLACVALVAIASFYVFAPLLGKSRVGLDIDLFSETELDFLLNRKSTIYRNLKDLELEYKMGRLSGTDFHHLSASYKNEAAAILEKLDRLGASENLDQVIEKAIAARKEALCGAKKGPEASRCPSCGAEIIPGKKYCADCGHQLWTK